CISFYILCIVLSVKSWPAIFGSLGYAYASYSAVLVAAGHTTKLASMGYAPAVLAGLILLTQRKYILGFITTLLFGTLLMYQNHLQILYYTFLIAVCLGVGFIIQTAKEKSWTAFGKAAGLAAVAGFLSLASYAITLMSTYDYSQETMRGGRSQLTAAGDSTNKTKGGLDKDYAFNWSYGITETFTFLVPRIFGGSNPTVLNNEYVSEFPESTKTAEVIAEKTGMQEEQARQLSMQFSPYWGPQPSTQGTVYLGAVVCVAFIFGLFFYTGWHKGWIIGACILGVLMAWGKHFAAFNYFLFDYLPLYNKFRAPSMALVIPQLGVPLIATLGLNALLHEKENAILFANRMKRALITTGAVAAVLVALYFTLDYRSESDSMLRDNLSNNMLSQMSQGKAPTADAQASAMDFGRSVTNALQADRKSIYRSDLFRSLIFMAITAGLFWFHSKKKLTGQVLAISLLVLGLIDLLQVDTRYLSSQNYVETEDFQTRFAPTTADLQIKQDTGYFRVFDASDPGGSFESTISSARTSYYHNNVGGYHPAKLGLYQDLIQNQLVKGNMQVYNMLNTRYFIVKNPQNNQPAVQRNPDALGPAWFVKTLRTVDNPNQEMNALDQFDPKDTAIIEKTELSKVSFQPVYDSSASISLTQNLNDVMTYSSKAASNQFAVFSEIYYPRGWKAFIDGKEATIVKVNYLLRGLPVPAGNHTIEFRFEPTSYLTGKKISIITGIISFVLLLAGIFLLWKRSNTTSKAA
ncbi:MAG TPA: YfhO family protein, partial [Flavitalea sp.]|nr:YfhO family protein [Flavitalea sp.]